jgi:hypothetical protein
MRQRSASCSDAVEGLPDFGSSGAPRSRLCICRRNHALGETGMRACVKKYAAGLEMNCPGDVLSQTEALKSQSSDIEQCPCQMGGAGPPLGREAAPGRAVLRRGLIAICSDLLSR